MITLMCNVIFALSNAEFDYGRGEQRQVFIAVK